MFESGKFFVGCNYWASHAGIYMWRNWNAEQVEQDLATLEKNGLQVIRMFLTWPDFQPLNRMYGGGCSLQEMRHGDKTLPDTEFGRAGLDPVMMERFRIVADLAPLVLDGLEFQHRPALSASAKSLAQGVESDVQPMGLVKIVLDVGNSDWGLLLG